MADHPQNAPRGLFQKERIDLAGSGSTDAQLSADSSGNLKLNVGLMLSGKTSNAITQNSTGHVFAAQIRVANKRYINANSTGFIVTEEAALPTTDNGVAFTMISNSTGVAMCVNSTGTTWKYLNTTSVQPT